jgi:hypothetical protein
MSATVKSGQTAGPKSVRYCPAQHLAIHSYMKSRHSLIYKIVEALMRFSFLIAALVVAAPISLCAGPASADAYDILFGTRHPYEGPWCAQMNTGAGRVEEDCTFKSFEACRQMVISGNRGFCTQNPAFTGYYEHPIRKKKRGTRLAPR